ncbi:ATP-binding protein [Paenibacillus hunanensis]|uniref:AlbA family DNA-binding domain-containing protein n=1 Tax=Paenibacillus hunanensis TaxID=539262 RepID=UPI002A69F22E|nr:ATP-binding protein [Paenibacillus hunanensis]WPP39868.1 ATP-binding protein [Paenibacillus hunanensis]
MNNAESIYYKIIDGGYEKIKSIYQEQWEETVFIDFKRKSAPSIGGAQRPDKSIYSEALSGFSNTSGGVIVWGISAPGLQDKADVAIGEEPIFELKRFLTDLNNATSQVFVPANPGVRNTAIYLNDDEECDKGFIVTLVPQSDFTPHRAINKDHKYYLRSGDSFVMMEHSILEDQFGRRQKPKLKIRVRLDDQQHYFLPNSGNAPFTLIIGIENEGKYIATYPCIKLMALNNLKIGNELGDHYNLSRLRQSEDEVQAYVGGRDDVIYPGSYIDVIKLIPIGKVEKYEFICFFIREDTLISFNYELYAPDIVPVKGVYTLSGEEISDFLGLIC